MNVISAGDFAAVNIHDTSDPGLFTKDLAERMPQKSHMICCFSLMFLAGPLYHNLCCDITKKLKMQNICSNHLQLGLHSRPH